MTQSEINDGRKCYRCFAPAAVMFGMCQRCRDEVVSAIAARQAAPCGGASSPAEYELLPINGHGLSIRDVKALNRTSRNGMVVRKGEIYS